MCTAIQFARAFASATVIIASTSIASLNPKSRVDLIGPFSQESRSRLIFVAQMLRWLTVGEVGALSDLDDVTVGIADIAANLAVLGDRLRDEIGSSTFP